MSNDDSERYVTHYYRRSPDPEGWIQTEFITQKAGDEHFYLGFGNKPFPAEKITRDIDHGSLQAVTPTLIHKGETLWITSEQDIGIASSTEPFKTPLNILYRDDVSVPKPAKERLLTALNAYKRAYEHAECGAWNAQWRAGTDQNLLECDWGIDSGWHPKLFAKQAKEEFGLDIPFDNDARPEHRKIEIDIAAQPDIEDSIQRLQEKTQTIEARSTVRDVGSTMTTLQKTISHILEHNKDAALPAQLREQLITYASTLAAPPLKNPNTLVVDSRYDDYLMQKAMQQQEAETSL